MNRGAFVIVAYRPKEQELEIYRECLGDLAQVCFIDAEDDRKQLLRQAEVIVCTGFTPQEVRPEEISCFQGARLIQLLFAGADNVPFANLPEKTIVASNAGAFAGPLAEHVLAMTLSLAKRLHRNHELLSRGVFDQAMCTQYLRGATCGIVGLGGNGRQVAILMKALGMRVYGVNRSGRTRGAPIDFIGTMEELDKLLKESDVVVLTVPLTPRTKGLIGEKELGWMKKNAILINVARGAVIDQAALFRHMKMHPEFRVGIDTWWSEPPSHGSFRLEYPFFDLPNLIGSPHIADHVPGMMKKATRRALENVRSYLLGGEIRGILNREDYLE